MGKKEELDLVEKVKAGDISSFEKLINLTSGKIYNLGLKFFKNKEDASDLMQEAYIKAYTNLKSFRGDSAFSTWLYSIATNVAQEKIRKDKRSKASNNKLKEALVSSDIKEMPDWTHNPVNYFKKQEMKTLLNKAIDSLPLKYRTVFILRDIEGFSISEVADMLNITKPTVKTRSHRSRLYLRETLGEFFKDKEKSRKFA